MYPEERDHDRAALESLILADLREASSESDQIGGIFAVSHNVRPTDFRALQHIMVAETVGQPITPGGLGQRMGLSGAAITYLVDRLIDSGHIRRDSHPADRRKVVLRYSQRGVETASMFFNPLRDRARSRLEELPDADLAAAHRVFAALIVAMRGFRADLAASESG